MSFFSAIGMGLREIWANKLRSSLTLFCVLLGVASVVLTVGYMQGLTAGWKKGLAARGGVERITVHPADPPDAQEPYAMKSPGHRVSDATAILKNVPHVRYAIPKLEQRMRLRYGGERDGTEVEGSVRETQYVKDIAVERGRFISDLDNLYASNVVVLGSVVRNNLFARDEDPLGKHVRIDGTLYEIIGLLPEYRLMMRSYNMLRWKNDCAYVPINTLLKRVNASPETMGIDVIIDDPKNLADVTLGIRNTLRGIHRGIQDFELDTREEMAANIEETERYQVATGAAVSLITIVIGGIGIMNLMLASINERIREIGIRKAIGARRRDIFIQFSVESVVLCIIGGVIGVGVGLAAIAVLQDLIEKGNVPVFTQLGVIMGFSASVVIGVVSGVYPAVKASRLDPIEALRHE